MNEEIWKVDKNIITCDLNNDCILNISKLENGIKITVKYSYDEKSVIVYTQFISNSQMGAE
jgi:hypothetical protein